MKNLITVDKEVIELNGKGIQTWLTGNGWVRLTQRIQSGETYVVMSLFNHKVANTADIIYKSELQKLIIDGNWVEVKDAVICRESDLKEENQ